MSTHDYYSNLTIASGGNTRREFLAKGIAAVGGAVLLGTALTDAVAAAEPATSAVNTSAARSLAADGGRPVTSAGKRVPIGGFASTTLGNWTVYDGIADPKWPNHMRDISASVRGIVHELGTAEGGRGVTVVAGHRSSWSRPFRHIERLQVGEVVRYDNYRGEGTQTEYRVVEIKYPLDPVAAYDEVCANTVAYGSDTRLNLYACCRRNGQPTSSVYRIVAFCVAV